jgi:hypothetical protein
MATLPGITSQYAKAVYIDHTRTMDSIPKPEYRASAMQYAADTYYIEDIQGAFDAACITQVQLDDTLMLKSEDDPQNR